MAYFQVPSGRRLITSTETPLLVAEPEVKLQSLVMRAMSPQVRIRRRRESIFGEVASLAASLQKPCPGLGWVSSWFGQPCPGLGWVSSWFGQPCPGLGWVSSWFWQPSSGLGWVSSWFWQPSHRLSDGSRALASHHSQPFLLGTNNTCDVTTW